MRKLIRFSCSLFLLFPLMAGAQPSPSTEAIPACILTSNQAVTNLVACGIKFNALGEIAVTVKNLGTVGVNVPTVLAEGSSPKRQAAPSGPPIPIDVYMQGAKIESVYLARIGGNELKTITLKIPSNYTKPECGQTRTISMTIDPAQQVAEPIEADNTRSNTTTRPCPDMAIEYINKNWNNLKTEFVAKIKLVNKGNAHAKFRYMAITSNSSSFGPIPSADHDAWMEIPAGQAKTFTIGNALFTQELYVKVFLDRWSEVEEMDEDNNFKEETLNN